jgi:hypothetical protein
VAGGVLQSLPLRVDNLPPGRHQIRATREGYNAFEQWVEIQGGQVVRVPILLERSAPTTGSILVTADLEGAAIYLDSRPTGLVTTAVIDDVPAGNHTVEIRPSDGAPFSRVIVVEPGRRAEVRARVRPQVQAATSGTIAVLVDQTGAIVRINGTPLPPGSYTREGLPPGTYVVQVLLEGYEPFRREVSVSAGQTTTVDVTLTAIQAPPGPISIRTNVPGARVFVDDSEFSAPYVARDPAGGSHAIRVVAEGYLAKAGATILVTAITGAGLFLACDALVLRTRGAAPGGAGRGLDQGLCRLPLGAAGRGTHHLQSGGTRCSGRRCARCRKRSTRQYSSEIAGRSSWTPTARPLDFFSEWAFLLW